MGQNPIKKFKRFCTKIKISQPFQKNINLITQDNFLSAKHVINLSSMSEMQNMSSDQVCALNVHMVCICDA